jgi:hypothetical protein
MKEEGARKERGRGGGPPVGARAMALPDRRGRTIVSRRYLYGLFRVEMHE